MTEITAHHGLFRHTNLYVTDTGCNGRTVVLIHGWPLSSESWSEQIPALSDAGYRVIAYDRRGFGRSDKPRFAKYDYDTLAGDVDTLLTELELSEVTLVGFSMGGGEVARLFAAGRGERVSSVVFACSVTPYLLNTPDNRDGPLTAAQAAKMAAALTADPERFYEDFTAELFSVDGHLKVTPGQRREAVELCLQADRKAVLECLAAFGAADFREDLGAVTVPALVLHGDGDGVVPLIGSADRTHALIPGSELVVISGAPHGCNVSHAAEFNQVLLDFLAGQRALNSPGRA
jgi:pimeloyl-ACP methyl ester carboxylesterase